MPDWDSERGALWRVRPAPEGMMDFFSRNRSGLSCARKRRLVFESLDFCRVYWGVRMKASAESWKLLEAAFLPVTVRRMRCVPAEVKVTGPTVLVWNPIVAEY